MSYGKMNSFIEIVSAVPAKDAEGFVTKGDTVLASGRAYFEPRNSTEKWRGGAVFAEVDALFRFRVIPGLDVTTEHIIVCGGKRYDIVSVENVRGRGMYLEVLGKAVDGSG
jgi:head-tail adaptor